MPYSNIDKPSKYFNTVLYTGTGSSLANTGVGFQPDWTWIKARSTTGGHRVYDAIRGATDTLYTNQDYASAVEAQTLTSFNSDGFTVGTDSGVNGSGVTFVAWNWLANGTGSSNTAGTISSTVSANTTSGFSVVTYTGTGSAATVGHGLGVAPSMIFLKIRSATDAWIVYSKSLGNTKIMVLNSTAAEATRADWNNTSPTSSVFSIGTFSNENTNAATYVAYCFAEIKGFSKFGSFSGNGSTDGTFVYTGFKPAFFLVKGSSNTSDWIMFDNKRDDINVVGRLLLPNSSGSESNLRASHYPLDFVSNGVKMRTDQLTGTTSLNASGVTYIYMAFAENPFVSSKGIPTTAR
jgi:hypothetical protein